MKNNTAENESGVGGYFIKVSDVAGRDFYSEETARAKTWRVEHADGILGKAQRAVWLEQGDLGKQMSQEKW